MYRHIIIKTKEYYDKVITEERNQGVVSSPIRVAKNEDSAHTGKSSPFLLLSKSNMNCSVKRNLMDYFNNHSTSSIMQAQIGGANSKSIHF